MSSIHVLSDVTQRTANSEPRTANSERPSPLVQLSGSYGSYDINFDTCLSGLLIGVKSLMGLWVVSGIKVLQSGSYDDHSTQHKKWGDLLVVTEGFKAFMGWAG